MQRLEVSTPGWLRVPLSASFFPKLGPLDVPLGYRKALSQASTPSYLTIPISVSISANVYQGHTGWCFALNSAITSCLAVATSLFNMSSTSCETVEAKYKCSSTPKFGETS